VRLRHADEVPRGVGPEALGATIMKCIAVQASLPSSPTCRRRSLRLRMKAAWLNADMRQFPAVRTDMFNLDVLVA
jgi:hypothetical protein